MYIRIPYGCKVYTVRLLVCLFVRFCFCILNPVRYTSGLARTGFTLYTTYRTGQYSTFTYKGGGCSPSASTPCPPTTACARTSDHSLTISNLPPPRYVNYVLQYRTGFLHVIPFYLAYYRTGYFSLSFPCPTPYGISNPTGRDFSLQYRTGFQQASLA